MSQKFILLDLKHMILHVYQLHYILKFLSSQQLVLPVYINSFLMDNTSQLHFITNSLSQILSAVFQVKILKNICAKNCPCEIPLSSQLIFQNLLSSSLQVVAPPLLFNSSITPSSLFFSIKNREMLCSSPNTGSPLSLIYLKKPKTFAMYVSICYD